MYYVYTIYNMVNGRRYIGITSNLKKRWYAHKIGRGSKLIKAAIDKYGLDNIWFVVMFKHPDLKVVQQLERDMIATQRQLGVRLYNIADGGEGAWGVKQTPESIAKRAAANTGKKRTAETRRRMAAWQIGRKMSPEARKKMSDAKRGRKQSVEAIQKRAKALQGHNVPESYRARLRQRMSKQVQVDGAYYPSIKSAAQQLGMKVGTLWSRFARYKKCGNFPAGWGYV